VTVRHQRGYVYKVGRGKRASFHIRFYQTELIEGKETRVQRSRLLCGADDARYSTTCPEVKKLADKFMQQINAQSGIVAVDAEDMKIVDFWDREYLPYCEREYKGTGMKPGSISVRVWLFDHELRPHFADRRLRTYRASDARAFLNSLKTTKSKAALRHIRALASSMFTEAINRNKLRGIEINPWKVKLPEDARDSAKTRHYTLEEAENIVSALRDRIDAQLVMSLVCFLGLRPGEVRGLQWGDIDNKWIHIRRAVDVLGNITTPKTAGSAMPVPLIDKVRVPLELWRRKCGGKALWVLSTTEKPVNLVNMINRVIKPALKHEQSLALAEKNSHLAKTLTWKSLYSGRRGAATIAVNSGSPQLAQRLLRHENLATTLAFYAKTMPDRELQEGMNSLYGKRQLKS